MILIRKDWLVEIICFAGLLSEEKPAGEGFGTVPIKMILFIFWTRKI